MSASYKSKQTKLWEDAKNHHPLKVSDAVVFWPISSKNFFAEKRSFLKCYCLDFLYLDWFVLNQSFEAGLSLNTALALMTHTQGIRTNEGKTRGGGGT